MDLDPLLAAYVDWMRLRSLSPRTVISRVGILGRLAAHVGKPLADMTAEDLADWQRWLRTRRTRTGRPMTATARHTYVKQVRSLFAWAVGQGLVPANPARVLVLPVLPQAKPRPVEETDLELALAAASGRVRAWLTLAALAGLRAIEVAGIQRDDVLDGLSPPLLRVRGKGDRQRWVPLTAPVLDALSPFLGATGRLFLRCDGRGPVNAHLVSETCNLFLHSLGIPASLHQLRHRFATVSYRSTKDLRAVQDLLGHVSVTTTARYTEPDGASTLAAVLAASAVNR